MNKFTEVKKLIAGPQGWGGCVQECQEALATDEVKEITGPTQTLVHLVRSTYGARQIITRENGLPTCGFEETLGSLSALPAQEPLTMWAVDTPDRFFVLFASESTGDLIGCIRVTSRKAGDYSK